MVPRAVAGLVLCDIAAALIARPLELEILAASDYRAGGMGVPPAVLKSAIAIPIHYWAGMLTVVYQVNRSNFEWALVTAGARIDRPVRREG